jgi:hypothetical protein
VLLLFIILPFKTRASSFQVILSLLYHQLPKFLQTTTVFFPDIFDGTNFVLAAGRCY